MKFYSELLNKLFDDEKSLTDAEAIEKAKEIANEKKQKEEAQRQKVFIDKKREAEKRVEEARKNYIGLLNAYLDEFSIFRKAEKDSLLASFFNLFNI